MSIQDIQSYYNILYKNYSEINDQSNLSNIKNLLEYTKIIQNNILMKEVKRSYCMVVTTWYNLYSNNTLDWNIIYEQL